MSGVEARASERDGGSEGWRMFTCIWGAGRTSTRREVARAGEQARLKKPLLRRIRAVE